jgi:hypothetical protein
MRSRGRGTERTAPRLREAAGGPSTVRPNPRGLGQHLAGDRHPAADSSAELDQHDRASAGFAGGRGLAVAAAERHRRSKL